MVTLPCFGGHVSFWSQEFDNFLMIRLALNITPKQYSLLLHIWRQSMDSLSINITVTLGLDIKLQSF